MLDFQPVTIENIGELAPFLPYQRFRACDYTQGAIFQWRAYFGTTFAVHENMLVMRTSGCEAGGCYAYPVGGGDEDAALAAIEADARERGIPLCYCFTPAEGVDRLRARYPAQMHAESDRDAADYLYEIDQLIGFPGKKMHGQKNHLNRFYKENPTAAFTPVTPENLAVAQAFLARYADHTKTPRPIEREEMLRAKELLDDMFRLGQKAGFVEIDGFVVALSVGEVVGDTLYVHVEKADVRYAGSYQAIVSAFANYTKDANTVYCNREDDSGEEGLRYSKMSYHPCGFVEKYHVQIDLT